MSKQKLVYPFVFILCCYPIYNFFASASETESTSMPEQQYIIRQVKFTGNRIFNRKELSNLIGMKPGQTFHSDVLKQGLQNILDEYRRRGLLFCVLTPQFEYAATTEPTVPSADSNASLQQIIITIQIQEGKPLTIGRISLEGNTLYTNSELKSELRLRDGALFNDEDFNTGIDRILRLYSENGHPKVTISPADIDLDKEKNVVNLKLIIDERPLVKISDVKVEGLQKTKPYVVLRELPIRPGDIYAQDKIDQSYHRLNNLGYFYDVNPAVLEEGATPDTIIFNAHVTEARTGRFNGILGYAPPTDLNQEAQLTGLIEARETNLLGTGRRVNILWKSGLREIYELGYEEPWVFGKPFTIGFEFSSLKESNPSTDAVSKEKSGSFIIGTKLTTRLESSLAITYKRIDLPADGFLFDGSQSGAKYALTFSLQRDSRDYFLNPTQGRLDLLAFEVSQGDFKLRKIWLDLNQYFTTWKKQVIAIGLHAASVYGDNIPPTELFYLGGANTLRGYNEDWFRGPRRLYSNLEYRLLTGRASQIFLFLDTGSVSTLDHPNKFESLKVGYGFGMRLESKSGLISMDYGLAAGESALEGKIHLSLGASF